MNSIQIENKVLRDALKRSTILDAIDGIHVELSAEKCYDKITPDFMKLEYAIFDENQDERLQLTEWQRYMHSLTIPNHILAKAFHNMPGDIEFLKRFRDIQNFEVEL